MYREKPNPNNDTKHTEIVSPPKLSLHCDKMEKTDLQRKAKAQQRHAAYERTKVSKGNDKAREANANKLKRQAEAQRRCRNKRIETKSNAWYVGISKVFAALRKLMASIYVTVEGEHC